MESCTSSSDPAAADGGVYAADIQTIFTARCVTCHGLNGDLDLSSGVSYGNLVSVESAGYAPYMRVQPGDPDNSVLYGKVSGSAFGDRMPLGQPPLTEAGIDDIRQWIADGALSD